MENPIFPRKKWCVYVLGSFCMHLFFVRDFNDIDHITPVVWNLQCLEIQKGSDRVGRQQLTYWLKVFSWLA
jgi:hypothetical protein